MRASDEHELVPVPRCAVRFPLELPLPDDFQPEEPGSWPPIEGSLEFVQGKLWYMPPCGDLQQDTTADVVTVLGLWRRSHPDFIVAGNEAGMLLGDDVRGADGAVWRRADVAPYAGKFRRVPPVLAVEVKGRFDTEAQLRDKAAWYFAHGVEVVWLLFPETQRALAVTPDGERSMARGERMPAHPSLPGLEPEVDELFAQVLAT